MQEKFGGRGLPCCSQCVLFLPHSFIHAYVLNCCKYMSWEVTRQHREDWLLLLGDKSINGTSGKLTATVSL